MSSVRAELSHTQVGIHYLNCNVPTTVYMQHNKIKQAKEYSLLC